ncbi:hypothetical protein OCA27_28800 [Bacillus cereus]|nr:hypothetical protein [Bacillus cereus]
MEEKEARFYDRIGNEYGIGRAEAKKLYKAFLAVRLASKHVPHDLVLKAINKSMADEKILENTYEPEKRDKSLRKRSEHDKPLWKRSGPNHKKVDMLDKEGNYIKSFDSRTEASKEERILAEGIARACRGQQKTAGGYKWRYSTKNN